MDLVEDHESEPIADVVGPEVRRVVRRDGEGLDVLLATAELTDFHVELGFALASPLFEQIDGRHDDERRRVERLDRREPDHGFPAASREFETAPVVVRAPRVERFLLVLSEFVRRPHVE